MLDHFFFFFKQKTAYEIRKGDWSSDVCSSDLELLLVDAEMQRAVSGVRHAVLAAGGTARDVRDEALEAAVDLALRIPDRAEQLRQRLHQLGLSLHDEQAVRHEAEVLRDRLEVLFQLGAVRSGERLQARRRFHFVFHQDRSLLFQSMRSSTVRSKREVAAAEAVTMA